MTKELQDKLYEKYPIIFQQKDLPMNQTCMCWGIECPDAWYGLLDNMCKEITELCEMYDISIIATQVKEKYGTLRFYHIEKDGPRWTVTPDGLAFDGQVKTDQVFNYGWVGGGESTHEAELKKRLDWILNRYDSLSGDICCDCGTYATYNNPIECTRGWVAYICKNCLEKNNKEKENKNEDKT